MLGAAGQAVAVAHDDARTAVAETVVELLIREAPRERHRDRPSPLARPVEERRLEPVVEDERHALAGCDGQATGDPPDAREQLAVGQRRERLPLRMPLAGRQ